METGRRFDLGSSDGGLPSALVISRSFPSSVFPTMGIFVERMTSVAAEEADTSVICPVPWAPPLPFAPEFDRYRRVERRRTTEAGVRVEYPRVPSGPGYLLHSVDAFLQYFPVRWAADRLHDDWGFDVIHAHFVYPEGVMAARLGRRFGVPVVTTEHAMWKPWLDDYPGVRRQVLSALEDIDVVSVVSEALARQVREAAPDAPPVHLLPNVVDERIFRLPSPSVRRRPGRLLFVGTVRHVKGLDVLIRAMPRVVERHADVRLRIVGEPFRRAYRRDEESVRAVVADLGLADRVEFVGGRPPEGVAREMMEATVLVVPSRRESFATVIPEAMACGTPVVATRSGGPEEIVTRDTGRLVPTENPRALADAVSDILSKRTRFSPEVLRSHAVSRYGRAATKTRLGDLYQKAFARQGRRDPDSETS